jgi:hypothetical protein
MSIRRTGSPSPETSWLIDASFRDFAEYIGVKLIYLAGRRLNCDACSQERTMACD